MVRRGIERAAVRHREELVGEHPRGDAGQLILALLFGGVWIADTFFLHYATILNQHVPLTVRLPLAFATLLAGGYLAWMGMAIMFGEERKEPRVVEKGVYALVRHPIYLGEILAYLGFLLFSISLAAVIVWLVAIAFLHHISRYEEKLLLDELGKAYEEYMCKVPMWIPRPSGP
jgi:protein-S-isoprenylcysteine O-methyltransferase Ste14